jgi:glycosyltransferase involved in cell wall biosynthesis
LTHARNLGKGAAVKTGFLAATGDIVLIQDADLEYDPQDYPRLIKPILDKKADVVFGSRFRGEYQRVLFFWHYVGNLMLTVLSNMFTNINISDMETGYKAFHKDVIRSIAPKLQSRRFGIEPELTARVAHGGPALPDGSRGTWRIYEVPISYSGRTYKEGKKIQWWDGVKAIGAIIYFNVFSR